MVEEPGREVDRGTGAVRPLRCRRLLLREQPGEVGEPLQRNDCAISSGTASSLALRCGRSAVLSPFRETVP